MKCYIVLFQEFSAFLHPEDAEHMRDIVVQETLEDIDKDGDGHVGINLLVFILIFLFLQVNIDEYIGDMYRDEGGEDGDHGTFLFKYSHYSLLYCQLSEPDWVASEREQFTQFRDTDGNGLMDLEEVKVV